MRSIFLPPLLRTSLTLIPALLKVASERLSLPEGSQGGSP